jgi:hypothetical protein
LSSSSAESKLLNDNLVPNDIIGTDCFVGKNVLGNVGANVLGNVGASVGASVFFNESVDVENE